MKFEILQDKVRAVFVFHFFLKPIYQLHKDTCEQFAFIDGAAWY